MAEKFRRECRFASSKHSQNSVTRISTGLERKFEIGSLYTMKKHRDFGGTGIKIRVWEFIELGRFELGNFDRNLVLLCMESAE